MHKTMQFKQRLGGLFTDIKCYKINNINCFKSVLSVLI